MKFGITSITAIIIALAALCASASAQGNVDYWYARGLSLAGDGHYEEAVNAYNNAISLNPENAGAWAGKAVSLGYLSLSNKNTNAYNDSLNAYDRAIELYYNDTKNYASDANAWYNLGLILKDRVIAMQSGENLGVNSDGPMRMQYLEESLKAYDRATEINPKFVAALRGKGNVLYILGRYNDSLNAYNAAIETDSKYALAWYNKGLALYDMGRYEEAVQAYDTAIEIGPEYADIWYNKGKALAGEGNYNGAADCYDKAIKLDPSLAAAWYYKGKAFESLNLDAAASAAFDKAKNLGYTNTSEIDIWPEI
jgi:tetratricopeptide (TPR) repeat protein